MNTRTYEVITMSTRWQTTARCGSVKNMDTCIVQVCCIWVIISPLGHQIKSLTSRFPAMAYVPYVYALVTGVGVQVPPEHARSGAHESGAADSR
jgi:hypothetical protein